jgi:hypothetical protein
LSGAAQLDPIEKSTRFGCGALIGLLFGVAVTLSWSLHQPFWSLVAIIIASLVGGMMVAKYGERALRLLLKFPWWW